MQLRESASVDNRNKWFISAQPLCPRQTLYDPMTDDYFSTLSATLLTVPRARTLVRDEVWSDIFFIAALILHMTRLSSLGQKTKRDIVELMPREDYETYHAKELNLDEKASAEAELPLRPMCRVDSSPAPSDGLTTWLTAAA